MFSPNMAVITAIGWNGQVLRLHREFKKHLTSKGFKTLHLVTWKAHLRSGIPPHKRTLWSYETPVQKSGFGKKQHIFHASRLPRLGELLENEIYQTNTLYRLSALSSFCVSSEAANNYMHWTTGFFSNLPSVLAKEAPSFSAELVLIQVWSTHTHTHTPVSVGRFLPWKMWNRKWLNKLPKSVQVESSKYLQGSCHGRRFEALLI